MRFELQQVQRHLKALDRQLQAEVELWWSLMFWLKRLKGELKEVGR